MPRRLTCRAPYLDSSRTEPLDTMDQVGRNPAGLDAPRPHSRPRRRPRSVATVWLGGIALRCKCVSPFVDIVREDLDVSDWPPSPDKPDGPPKPVAEVRVLPGDTSARGATAGTANHCRGARNGAAAGTLGLQSDTMGEMSVMTAPSPRTLRRQCTAVGGLVLVVLGIASPAWAHVTVHPPTMPAGSKDVELTFRVPNERQNADTVMVQVFFPTNLPLLTVDVLPVPGWSATVHTQTLATPVKTDDGLVSQIVTDVAWRSMSGGIAPGQYEDFSVAAGSVPHKPAQLVFKALQTYSSGEIVRWIEVPVAGQPEPDTPAPVVTLTPPASPTSANRSAVSPISSDTNGSNATEALAIGALVLSGLSIAGVTWLMVRVRRHT